MTAKKGAEDLILVVGEAVAVKLAPVVFINLLKEIRFLKTVSPLQWMYKY